MQIMILRWETLTTICLIGRHRPTACAPSMHVASDGRDIPSVIPIITQRHTHNPDNSSLFSLPRNILPSCPLSCFRPNAPHLLRSVSPHPLIRVHPGVLTVYLASQIRPTPTPPIVDAAPVHVADAPSRRYVSVPARTTAL